MQAVNLQEQHREYYRAASTPEIVKVEGGRFVCILGSGTPGSEVFYAKKAALRGLMQQIEELCGRRGSPFLIPPLEISYWYANLQEPVTIGRFYTTYPLGDLRYRMMIRVPGFVMPSDLEQAGNTARYGAEIFEMSGGTVLQVLHKGPFADELRTLKLMQNHADAQQVRKSGPHHEIHLTDWEKGQSQDHLRTILRDPVEQVSSP